MCVFLHARQEILGGECGRTHDDDDDDDDDYDTNDVCGCVSVWVCVCVGACCVLRVAMCVSSRKCDDSRRPEREL